MSNKSTVQADDGSLPKAEKTQRKLKRIFLSKRSHCERLHTLQLPLLSQKDKAMEKVKESSGCWQVGRGKEKSQRAGPWKHSVWCHIGGMCSRYKFVRVYNRKSEHWCESQALVRGTSKFRLSVATKMARCGVWVCKEAQRETSVCFRQFFMNLRLL